jgi:hypothetical protein
VNVVSSGGDVHRRDFGVQFVDEGVEVVGLVHGASAANRARGRDVGGGVSGSFRNRASGAT